MFAIWDAFWRAVAYCLHPRVLLWSLLPLALATGLVAGLGWLYWDTGVAALRSALEHWQLWAALMDWVDRLGGQRLHELLAPLIIVLLAVPLVVVIALVLVALLVTPAIVALVEKRRFADLERKHGAAWWQQIVWSLSCTVAALLAMLLSLPLWLVPPLVLVLPPLIWGWLTCRVMAYDVLALHASREERRKLLRTHRLALLAMGVASGFLGATPSALFAFGAVGVALAPLLGLLAMWLYTLVFAFAACWFAHYLLAELQVLRNTPAASPANPSLPIVERVDTVPTTPIEPASGTTT